jgi:serine/threonine protein kinase
MSTEEYLKIDKSYVDTLYQFVEKIKTNTLTTPKGDLGQLKPLSSLEPYTIPSGTVKITHEPIKGPIVKTSITAPAAPSPAAPSPAAPSPAAPSPAAPSPAAPAPAESNSAPLPEMYFKEIGAGGYGFVISPAIPNIIDGKKVYYPKNVSKVFDYDRNYNGIVSKAGILPSLIGHNEGHRINTYKRVIEGKNLPYNVREKYHIKDNEVIKAVRMPNLGVDLSKVPANLDKLRAVPIPYMIDQIVKLMTQLEGLYTHGYIHGDIRETNIMIHPVEGTITLIDFDLLKPFDEFHKKYSRVYGFYSNPPECLLYRGLKSQENWGKIPSNETKIREIILDEQAKLWANMNFSRFNDVLTVRGARNDIDLYEYIYKINLKNLQTLQNFSTVDEAYLKGVVPKIDIYSLGITLANMLIQLYGPEAMGQMNGSPIDDAYISSYAKKLSTILTNRGAPYTESQLKACARAICRICAVADNMSRDELIYRLKVDPTKILALVRDIQTKLAAAFLPPGAGPIPPAAGPIPPAAAPAPAPAQIMFTPLRNHNANCYMDSSIQLLFSISEMRHLLDKLNYAEINKLEIDKKSKRKECIISDETLFNKKKIITAFKKIYDKYKENKLYDLTEVKFDDKSNAYEYMFEYLKNTDKTPKFSKNFEQDVDEYIKTILDIFDCIDNDDIKNFLNKLYVNEQTFLKCKDSNENISNSEGARKDKDYIKGEGQTIKKKNISKILTIILDNGNSIQDSINIKMDTWEDVEFRRENFCKDYIVSTQNKLIIPENNKYLIIQWNRFGQIYNDEGEPIPYKIEDSIIPDNVIQIGDVEYKLRGIILHSGSSIKAGHYKYVYYNNDMTKTVINDIASPKNGLQYITHNSPIKNEEINENGYIYLYERMIKPKGGAYRVHKTISYRRTFHKTRKLSKH